MPGEWFRTMEEEEDEEEILYSCKMILQEPTGCITHDNRSRSQSLSPLHVERKMRQDNSSGTEPRLEMRESIHPREWCTHTQSGSIELNIQRVPNPGLHNVQCQRLFKKAPHKISRRM